MEHAGDTEAASQIGIDPPTTDRPEGNQSPEMNNSEMLPPPESQGLPAEVIPQPELHGRSGVNAPKNRVAEGQPGLPGQTFSLAWQVGP